MIAFRFVSQLSSFILVTGGIYHFMNELRKFEITAHGKPGIGRIVKMSPLVPGPDEVVVHVSYCGLNHLDLWMEAGELPININLPRVPGGEISGTISRSHASVSFLTPGTPVAVQSNVFCGRCDFCLNDEQSLCLDSQLLGVHRDGGLASEILVPARGVTPLEKDVNLAHVAASTLAGSTAMHMLTNRYQVQPGQWVLAPGAASGVGSFAIQIARELGARVITTGSTPEKRSLGLSLGAEAAFNHYDPNWPSLVRKFTGKKGVDLIVEHIGGAVLEASFHCLARNGTIVTCGATAGKNVQLNLWPFFVKQHAIIGSYGRTHKDFLNTLDWLRQGRIKPVIHAIKPLAESGNALNELRQGRVLGKSLVQLQSH